MDGKRKHFVPSGGYKKKRKQFLEGLAVPSFLTSIESNSNSTVPSTSENVDEFVEIPEITNSESTEHEEISDVNEIQVISSIDSQRENVNSESIHHGEIPFDINHFQYKLGSWAVANKVKHDQLRGLLQIWNECVPLPQLPVDPRTVLATPREVHLENENYWHYGLKKSLNKLIQRIENVPEKLSLKINVDGIPISKSSNVECWPILCELKELPKLQPFIVGVYCGTSMIVKYIR